MAKPLKTELHHWWPKSLSQFWANNDGFITKLSSDGSEVRSQPKRFGAIKNAHHVKMGDPSGLWDSTFETKFNKADNQFPDLIEWLYELDFGPLLPKSTFQKRFKTQEISKQERRRLAECLASLITRSPCSRNNVKITVEYYRQTLPKKDRETDKSLIAANMFHVYEAFVHRISMGGKFAVLIADGSEFIFGEGFLHNFPIPADTFFDPRCVIPLTPNVAVLFTSPLQYRTKPELVTMQLTEKEVRMINGWVQIYSKDNVFYRNENPEILANFAEREFQQLRFHSNQWLDQLIDQLANFVPEFTSN